MIITLDKRNKQYRFVIELEKEDSTIGVGQGTAEIELLHNTFHFDLPFDIKDPHPDLITLSILTVVLPWIGEKVTLPHKVSPEFSAAVFGVLGIQVDGIDHELKARKKGSRGGLAFSGGVDSIAASLVLPDDTVNCTFIRREHTEVPDRQQFYSIHATEKIVDIFENTYAVYSDLEHIVGPWPQFPTWVTLSIPCFLLADHFDLHSISYGSVLGSVYFVSGKYREQDIPNCADWVWRPIFAAVGIDLHKPVASLSEVGTLMITNESTFNDIASSCQYGLFQKPCMKCIKCLRKYCISIALTGEMPSKSILDTFWQQKSIRDFMTSSVPIDVQHIFMYVFSKIKRSDLRFPYRIFSDKLNLCDHVIDWNSRYYPQALTDFILDPTLRESVRGNIEKYVEPMSSEDIEIVRTWDLNSHYTNNDEIECDIDRTIAFYWDKKKVDDESDNLKNRIIQLQENLNKKDEYLLQISKKIKQVENNFDQLVIESKVETRRIQELLNHKQGIIESLKKSLRYRIGDVVINSMSHPLEVIKLPYRLYQLYKERKSNRNPIG